MDYIYFVSYAHESGFGNSELTVTGPITSIEHTKEIARRLETASRKQVVVLNFVLLNYAQGLKEDENKRTSDPS